MTLIFYDENFLLFSHFIGFFFYFFEDGLCFLGSMDELKFFSPKTV